MRWLTMQIFSQQSEGTPIYTLPSRLRIFALLSSSLIVKLMSGMDHIWLYTLPQRHVPSSQIWSMGMLCCTLRGTLWLP